MANPKLDIEISAKLDNLDREFGRVSNMARDTAGKVESAFSNVGTSLKSMAGGLAAAFSVDMFVGMVKGSIDAQDRINDLSKSTSLTVETLAGLGAAARKSGSNLDDVAGAINKLSVNMGKEPEKFREIGVTAKEPIEALKQLADVFVSIKDPQERAAFAAATLGKSWAGTAPLLAEGGKAIGEMVEKGTRLSKVTAESAKAADELNDRLEDLQTASQGTKTAFANLLVPSLIDTAKAMEELSEKGNPLLALLRGFAGLGKLPFDLALGSVDMSINGQLKDLQQQLSDLERKRDNAVNAGGGLINQWLYGKKGDLDQQITITKNQIDALQKYGDKLKPGTTSEIKTDGTMPNVRKFLDGNGTVANQISEGQRLIDQLKDRLLTTQNLTEVEKLEAQFADEKYKKASAGEREIAIGIAAQIDARKALMTELDAELAMVKNLSKEDDAQDARLKSLVSGTDIGKNNQNMLDQALAESALSSGKIDTSTYDQIIAKLHEVKDEGKDAFKDLETAIDGWGKKSAAAFVDFAYGAKTSFSDLILSMSKEMATMAVYENITKPMSAGISAWAKGLFSSNADGGVYSSPGLSAYSGSVVSSPTVFPFASGIGLMGEAGPEAILPLKRGKDGKLGITSNSSSSMPAINVHQTINIDSRSDKASIMQGLLAIKEQTKSEILDSMRRAGAFAR